MRTSLTLDAQCDLLRHHMEIKTAKCLLKLSEFSETVYMEPPKTAGKVQERNLVTAMRSLHSEAI